MQRSVPTFRPSRSRTTRQRCCWDLTRFQLFVLKVGGEIIKHSRRAILRIAESAEPLWSRLISRIERWELPEHFSQPAAKRRAWMPPPAHANLTEVLRC